MRLKAAVAPLAPWGWVGAGRVAAIQTTHPFPALRFICEKSCDSHNETFWAEQGRFPKFTPKWLDIIWKGG